MPYDPGRPQTDEHLPYFSKYIDLVPDGRILDHLKGGFERDQAVLRGLSTAQVHYRYAPEKWSVLEVLGHLSDAERVFTYRALRIARGDATPLAGFDEQAWMQQVNFETRDLSGLLDEWAAVRATTLALFEHLESPDWARRGVVNGHSASVRALAYITAGHEEHHMRVLRERYGLAV